MQLRDAVAPIPDPSFARRVAVATGITTAIAIGGAVAAICSASPRAVPIPKQLPTLAVASMYAGPAVAQPAEIARANDELRVYTYETYPSWLANNPDRRCPRHLLELNYYAPSLHAVDPWGSPYQFICGEQFGSMLLTRSAGPDRMFDTADDLSTAP
jgi:hypothetical protein